MDRKQVRTGSSSRFQLQRVSTNTRNATFVDTGCQRCQHCTLRRWGMRPASTEMEPINGGMNLKEASCRQ